MLTHRIRLLLINGAMLLVGGNLVLGCAAQTDGSTPDGEVLTKNGRMDGRDAFAIDLPASCRFMTEGLQVDFEIYRVTCGSTPYVGLYVGNFGDGTPPGTRILRTKYAWPTEVRVWSERVAGDQARADEIAASVQLKNPK